MQSRCFFVTLFFAQEPRDSAPWLECRLLRVVTNSKATMKDRLSSPGCSNIYSAAFHPDQSPPHAFTGRRPQDPFDRPRLLNPAMRALTLLFAVGGLALGTGLVAYFGFSEVARALFTVRWTGFLMIVVFHLALTALLGVCWYLLTSQSAPLRAFVFGRFVRDSGSEILPLSQVGGFVMGTRAAVLLGLPGAVGHCFDDRRPDLGDDRAIGLHRARPWHSFGATAERSSDRLDCSWHRAGAFGGDCLHSCPATWLYRGGEYSPPRS